MDRQWVWVYATHQADGLVVDLFNTTGEAEGALLEDATELLGWPIGDSEIEAVLDDAQSKKGFEMSANKLGTDDIVMYIRKGLVNATG